METKTKWAAYLSAFSSNSRASTMPVATVSTLLFPKAISLGPAFRRSSVFPAFIGLFIVVVFLRHIYIALHSLNERQSFSRFCVFSWVFEGNAWDLKLNTGPRPS